MKVPPEIPSLIQENKSFLITTHINPDGDALGSSIALFLGLRKIGKDVSVITKDDMPEMLKFLPFSDVIGKAVPDKIFDVLFIIDCGDIKRTGLKDLKAKKAVIIDHHLTETDNAGVKWVNSGAGATGEMVYLLLNSLGVSMDEAIATNLYTAIFTDTGGFRYPNTRPETLRIAAGLIEAGVDPWKIAQEVYESISHGRFRLITESLSTFERKGSIAWIIVTQEMYKKTGATPADTENFANYPRMIKGVEVSMLFRELDNGDYKVSLRSKDRVNVAKIAESLGGGGHYNAAGCELHGTLQEVKERVLRAIVENSDGFGN